MMTTKQAELHSTSHLAAGDIIPPALPTSTTIVQHSEKSAGLTSYVFPVTTNISSLTQPDEISQVSDDGLQPNAGVNITKDTTISE